jgi:hypothetical protein
MRRVEPIRAGTLRREPPLPPVAPRPHRPLAAARAAAHLPRREDRAAGRVGGCRAVARRGGSESGPGPSTRRPRRRPQWQDPLHSPATAAPPALPATTPPAPATPDSRRHEPRTGTRPPSPGRKAPAARPVSGWTRRVRRPRGRRWRRVARRPRGESGRLRPRRARIRRRLRQNPWTDSSRHEPGRWHSPSMSPGRKAPAAHPCLPIDEEGEPGCVGGWRGTAREERRASDRTSASPEPGPTVPASGPPGTPRGQLPPPYLDARSACRSGRMPGFCPYISTPAL